MHISYFNNIRIRKSITVVIGAIYITKLIYDFTKSNNFIFVLKFNRVLLIYNIPGSDYHPY